MTRLTAILGIAALFSSTVVGQTATPAPPDSPQPQAHQFQVTDYSKPFRHFPNPIKPYMPHDIPAPNLNNTPRLDQLVQNGKLMLSLDDAIALALENNLDIAIARYNLNIADVDVLRSKAGAALRGVNTGVVQGTPGGGVGGIGNTSTGSGAGGTTTGTGGAGAGSSGIVLSTSGVGSAVPSYDPVLTGTLQWDHDNALSNNSFSNPLTRLNSNSANFSYGQGFATGTNLSVGFNNSRQSTGSTFATFSPGLTSNFRATVSQHLLQGFGFLPNTRFIRIAKNNRQISDVAFRLQIISTVNQIQNIYWDLVNAYENVKVQQESLQLADKTLGDNKKQVEIGTLAPIEVVRAQSVVATNQQSLIVAKTNLELEQLLIKNALSRTLVDPRLAEAEVIPTSTMSLPRDEGSTAPIEDLLNNALTHRAELQESKIDLTNRQITNKSARNALLPSLDAFAYYGGSGLGGMQNPNGACGAAGAPDPPLCVPLGAVTPIGYGGTLNQLVNSTASDKGMGITLTIPIRNRSAQADQIQAQLEYRQAQMRLQQLENQVRIEVRNAQYSVQQNRAAVESAQAAVELAKQSLDAEQKKYSLGASTTTLVLQAQRDRAQAQSNMVAATANYQKSRVELDRATGLTLDHNGILMDDAVKGQVSKSPHVPYVVPASETPSTTTQPAQPQQ
ncbi:MAG TPA: TolC family protein [Terriglobales bacterium]|nr:TolC family protein [Terriglobales bacterium]